MSTTSPQFPHLARHLGMDADTLAHWTRTSVPAPARARLTGILASCDAWLTANGEGRRDSARLLAAWALAVERSYGRDAARAALAVLARARADAAARRDARRSETLEGAVAALRARLGIDERELDEWVRAHASTTARRALLARGLSSYMASLPAGGDRRELMGTCLVDWLETQTLRVGGDYAWRLGNPVIACLRWALTTIFPAGDAERARASAQADGATADSIGASDVPDGSGAPNAAPATAADADASDAAPSSSEPETGETGEAGADPLDTLCALLNLDREELFRRVEGLSPKRLRVSCPGGLRAFSRWLSENRPGVAPTWADLDAWREQETRAISNDMASQHHRGVASVLAGILEGTPEDRPWEKAPSRRGARRQDPLDGLCERCSLQREALEEWFAPMTDGRRHIATTALRRFGRWMTDGAQGTPGTAEIEEWYRSMLSEVTLNAANRYRQNVEEWLAWLEARAGGTPA